MVRMVQARRFSEMARSFPLLKAARIWLLHEFAAAPRYLTAWLGATVPETANSSRFYAQRYLSGSVVAWHACTGCELLASRAWMDLNYSGPIRVYLHLTLDKVTQGKLQCSLVLARCARWWLSHPGFGRHQRVQTDICRPLPTPPRC
jgi:hypothetical protein